MKRMEAFLGSVLDYLFFILTPKDKREKLLNLLLTSKNEEIVVLAEFHLETTHEDPEQSFDFMGGFSEASNELARSLSKQSSLFTQEKQIALIDLFKEKMNLDEKQVVPTIIDVLQKNRVLAYLQGTVFFFYEGKKFHSDNLPESVHSELIQYLAVNNKLAKQAQELKIPHDVENFGDIYSTSYHSLIPK